MKIRLCDDFQAFICQKNKVSSNLESSQSVVTMEVSVNWSIVLSATFYFVDSIMI